MNTPSPDFDFRRLNSDQKLDLITSLWDSLGDSAETLPIPDWHREALDERIAQADAAPESAIPFDEAMARLRIQC